MPDPFTALSGHLMASGQQKHYMVGESPQPQQSRLKHMIVAKQSQCASVVERHKQFLHELNHKATSVS